MIDDDTITIFDHFPIMPDIKKLPSLLERKPRKKWPQSDE